MVKFEDLGLELNDKTKEVRWGEDIVITVKQYLPVNQKVDLLSYIVGNAIDDNSGCFSPLRIEVFFSIAICRWYTDIEFDDNNRIEDIYDLLDSSGMITTIIKSIPEEEFEFVKDLVNNTTADIARYNNSAAGIIQFMNSNAKDLDSLVSSILNSIQNSEGLETLSAIKDMVGTD